MGTSLPLSRCGGGRKVRGGAGKHETVGLVKECITCSLVSLKPILPLGGGPGVLASHASKTLPPPQGGVLTDVPVAWRDVPGVAVAGRSFCSWACRDSRILVASDADRLVTCVCARLQVDQQPLQTW